VNVFLAPTKNNNRDAQNELKTAITDAYRNSPMGFAGMVSSFRWPSFVQYIEHTLRFPVKNSIPKTISSRGQFRIAVLPAFNYKLFDIKQYYK
jgi:hypothetical protein